MLYSTRHAGCSGSGSHLNQQQTGQHVTKLSTFDVGPCQLGLWLCHSGLRECLRHPWPKCLISPLGMRNRTPLQKKSSCKTLGENEERLRHFAIEESPSLAVMSPLTCVTAPVAFTTQVCCLAVSEMHPPRARLLLQLLMLLQLPFKPVVSARSFTLLNF